MKKFFNNAFIALLGLLVLSCSSEEELTTQWIDENDNGEVTVIEAGSLDLSNYVAIGNSLTAGFADAALHPLGQQYSVPSVLSGQLRLAGAGDFVYPDITSGNGFGFDKENSGVLKGKSFIDLETALAAIAGAEGATVGAAIQSTVGSALTPSSVTGSGLNNFGVPGARAIDLDVNGYGVANPYYGAFQSSVAASILDDAVSANGSFFSLWIGSNDVLGYATDGGNDTPNAFGTNVLTPVEDFSTALTTILDDLSAKGAEGIILNIPPVTLIPFFQTVTNLAGGVNLIPIDNQQNVDVLKTYAAYNKKLDSLAGIKVIMATEAAQRKINWEIGANPPVIMDESLTDLTSLGLPSMRQAQVNPLTGASDLFPLTALAVIGVESIPGDASSVYGVGVPIPDQFSLTMTEQVSVITAYATFNGMISAQVAARPNLTLVDVGPLFADMFGLTSTQAGPFGLNLSEAAQAAADGALGIVTNGVNLVPLSLSEEELFNSVWSTDGIHPNPRGVGLIVNEIIATLNSTYGSSIPMVNPLDLPGINAPL